MVSAILSLLLSVARELLPALMPKLVEFLTTPPDPIKIANRDYEEAITTGDLNKLSAINQTIVDSSGQNDLTKNQLNNMLGF